MKRLFSLFLCFSMLPLSLLTGCSMSGSHSATEPSPTKPRHPDRLSDVTIITGNSDTEVYAGEQLKNYLEKKNVNCTNGAFRISVLIDESIVDDGYKIFTDENCKEGLSIVGGNGRGVLYGVYRFLEDYAGIRFFTPTLEVIPDDDILFDEINIEYIPVFTKRSMDWYSVRTSIDWMVKNGINDCAWVGVFPENQGGSWNCGLLSVHTLGVLTETGGAGSPNPCLTYPENLSKPILSAVITS